MFGIGFDRDEPHIDPSTAVLLRDARRLLLDIRAEYTLTRRQSLETDRVIDRINETVGHTARPR